VGVKELNVKGLINSGFHLRTIVVLLTLFCWGLTGCYRSQQSKVSALAQNLTLSGTVIDLAGNPVHEALVYIELAGTSSAITDEEGNFTFTLEQLHLSQIKHSVPYENPVFYLYFERGQGDLLTAVSPPIELDRRGSVSVGTITLRPALTVSGRITFIGARKAAPSQNKTHILLGRTTTEALEDGSFKLMNVTAGMIPFIVAREGYETYRAQVDTTALQFASFVQNLTLFSTDDAVSGVLLPLAAGCGASSGGPDIYCYEFMVKASKKSKFVRVAAQREKLQQANAGSAWHAVDRVLREEFAAAGSQTLFYQFSDETHTVKSPIYELKMTIEPFADSKGFKINGGELTTSSPTVTLDISVPKLAVSMRLACNSEDITKKPWMSTASHLLYNFNPAVSGEPMALHTIYLQFREERGNESVVFTQQIKLDLFAVSEGKSPLMVGNGAAVITEATPLVTVNPPSRSVAMRISEDLLSLAAQPWQGLVPQLRVPLTGRMDEAYGLQGSSLAIGTGKVLAGPHTLHVQFKDEMGFVSNVFSQAFIVDLFPLEEVPFRIEGGAVLTPFRTVALEIQPPVNAYEMRIFEKGASGYFGSVTYYGSGAAVGYGTPDSTLSWSAGWMRVQSSFMYTFHSDGDKDLFLQFRDVSGNVSSVYQRSIRVQPFLPVPGSMDLIIGDGLGVTTEAEQVLTIIAPQGAAYMAISDDFAVIPQNGGDAWQAITSHVPVTLKRKGRTVFTLRFRNLNGVLSHVVQKEILYLPYPEPETIVSINDSDEYTLTHNVTLNLNIPVTAVSMRVSEDETLLATQEYIKIDSRFELELADVYGTHTVYVQFKLADGTETVLYEDTILYLPVCPTPTPSPTPTESPGP
jgi:hypothetical protein